MRPGSREESHPCRIFVEQCEEQINAVNLTSHAQRVDAGSLLRSSPVVTLRVAGVAELLYVNTCAARPWQPGSGDPYSSQISN